MTGWWMDGIDEQCSLTTRSDLDPSNRREKLPLCIGWPGFRPGYHTHDVIVPLRGPIACNTERK